MKVHIGELINLIKNNPVPSGHTISHSTMRELVENGLGKNTDNGYTPTDRGKWIYNQLTCKTLDIEEKHSFIFHSKSE